MRQQRVEKRAVIELRQGAVNTSYAICQAQALKRIQMEAKKAVTLKITLLLVLLALRGFAADSDENYLDGSGYQFRYISMKQVEISRGKTISQILTYIGFNSNLDYWLTVFVNPKNEEISMHTGVDIEHNFTIGEKVKVIWELTTLCEAGEGDAPYYFWSIVEIEDIELSQSKTE